jgi:hypothetical protein
VGFRSGAAGPRLRNTRALIVIAGALAAIAVVAVLVIKLVEPGQGPPPCAPDQPCAGPPPAPPRLAAAETWRSSELRFRFRYPAELWNIEETGPVGVVLTHRKHDLVVIVRGVRSSDADGILDDEFQELRSRIPELTRDRSKAHRLYGPNVGYRDGVGRAYRAATQAGTLSVLMMAATHRGMSALVLAATGAPDVSPQGSRLKDGVLASADSLLNTFRWPGE